MRLYSPLQGIVAYLSDLGDQCIKAEEPLKEEAQEQLEALHKTWGCSSVLVLGPSNETEAEHKLPWPSWAQKYIQVEVSMTTTPDCEGLSEQNASSADPLLDNPSGLIFDLIQNKATLKSDTAFLTANHSTAEETCIPPSTSTAAVYQICTPLFPCRDDSASAPLQKKPRSRHSLPRGPWWRKSPATLHTIRVMKRHHMTDGVS